MVQDNFPQCMLLIGPKDAELSCNLQNPFVELGACVERIDPHELALDLMGFQEL